MFILIGAGGFIGYSLASFLTNKKIKYATISRSYQWNSLPFESRFVCSASNLPFELNELSDNAEVVYMAGSPNLVAAELDPFADLQFHIDELSEFLKSYSDSNFTQKKLFFLSSAGTVYGDCRGELKNENSPFFPKSMYGKRNIILESIVQAASVSLNMQSTILRVTNPFGPGQNLFRRRGLIQSLLDSVVSRKSIAIRGNGYQVRDYIYSSDLSAMIYSIVNSDTKIPLFNISSGYSFSARQIVEFMQLNSIYPVVEYCDECRDFEVVDSLVSPNTALAITGLDALNINPLTLQNLQSMLNIIE